MVFACSSINAAPSLKTEFWPQAWLKGIALYLGFFLYTFSAKINEAYGELDGNLHMVGLERGKNGLGLSLAGNRNLGVMSVFVVGIQAGSPVAEDGRIRVGDELLEVSDNMRCVNDVSMSVKSSSGCDFSSRSIMVHHARSFVETYSPTDVIHVAAGVIRLMVAIV